MASKAKSNFRVVKRSESRPHKTNKLNRFFQEKGITVIQIQDFRRKVFEIFGGNNFFIKKAMCLMRTKIRDLGGDIALKKWMKGQNISSPPNRVGKNVRLHLLVKLSEYFEFKEIECRRLFPQENRYLEKQLSVFN